MTTGPSTYTTLGRVCKPLPPQAVQVKNWAQLKPLYFPCKSLQNRSGETRIRTGDTMIFSPRMSLLMRPILSENWAYIRQKTTFEPYVFPVAYSCVLFGLQYGCSTFPVRSCSHGYLSNLRQNLSLSSCDLRRRFPVSLAPSICLRHRESVWPLRMFLSVSWRNQSSRRPQ